MKKLLTINVYMHDANTFTHDAHYKQASGELNAWQTGQMHAEAKRAIEKLHRETVRELNGDHGSLLPYCAGHEIDDFEALPEHDDLT